MGSVVRAKATDEHVVMVEIKKTPSSTCFIPRGIAIDVTLAKPNGEEPKKALLRFC
jgi:hypothetical protein